MSWFLTTRVIFRTVEFSETANSMTIRSCYCFQEIKLYQNLFPESNNMIFVILLAVSVNSTVLKITFVVRNHDIAILQRSILQSYKFKDISDVNGS